MRMNGKTGNPKHQSVSNGGDRDDGASGAPDWSPDHGYQFDMTMISTVQIGDLPAGANTGILGAFVNGEPRGSTRLIYVELLDQYFAFIMAHSDVLEGETVSFRFYDDVSGEVLEIAETMIFNSDGMSGSLSQPVLLHAEESAEETNPSLFTMSRIYPNPVVSTGPSLVSWAMPSREHVSLKVFDVQGRLVRTVVDETMSPGRYSAQIHTRGLPSGVYLYRMQAGVYENTQKFMVVK